MTNIFETAYKAKLDGLVAELTALAAPQPEAVQEEGFSEQLRQKRANALAGKGLKATDLDSFLIQARQWVGNNSAVGGVHCERAMAMGLLTNPSGEDNVPEWSAFADDVFEKCGYKQT